MAATLFRAFFRTAVIGVTVVAIGCSNAPPPSARAAGTPQPAHPSNLGVVSGQIPNVIPGAIVVLAPSGTAPQPPQTRTPALDQVQLTFIPDILIARAGFPVAFHSNDAQLHNINVQVTGKRFAEFNRSIPPGGTFEHVFEEPGFYDVRCDIHPAMTAEIFVSPSPYAIRANDDGSFAFENIPPGHYTLIVYNGAGTSEKGVDVAVGANQVRVDGDSGKG